MKESHCAERRRKGIVAIVALFWSERKDCTLFRGKETGTDFGAAFVLCGCSVWLGFVLPWDVMFVVIQSWIGSGCLPLQEQGMFRLEMNT